MSVVKCDVVTLDNGKAGKIDLSDDVFGLPMRGVALPKGSRLPRRRRIRVSFGPRIDPSTLVPGTGVH